MNRVNGESSDITELIVKPYRDKSSHEMIEVFSTLSRQDYAEMFAKFSLTERQIANWYGRKDELFLEHLIGRIIAELQVSNWSVDKITSSRDPRMGLRIVGAKKMYFGGDSVLFQGDRPMCIVQCKEYLDTIRVKELIGESLMLKALTDGALHTGPVPLFVVFANVWELTKEWQSAVQNCGLKGYVDEFFVVRPGKRKDKGSLPSKDELQRFKRYIEKVIRGD
jgi:hypothetical protein